MGGCDSGACAATRARRVALGCVPWPPDCPPCVAAGAAPGGAAPGRPGRTVPGTAAPTCAKGRSSLPDLRDRGPLTLLWPGRVACPSGRRCSTRNAVWCNSHPGFKSQRYRHGKPRGPSQRLGPRGVLGSGVVARIDRCQEMLAFHGGRPNPGLRLDAPEGSSISGVVPFRSFDLRGSQTVRFVKGRCKVRVT